jgi:hypothetical protein
MAFLPSELLAEADARALHQGTSTQLLIGRLVTRAVPRLLAEECERLLDGPADGDQTVSADDDAARPRRVVRPTLGRFGLGLIAGDELEEASSGGQR